MGLTWRYCTHCTNRNHMYIYKIHKYKMVWTFQWLIQNDSLSQRFKFNDSGQIGRLGSIHQSHVSNSKKPIQMIPSSTLKQGVLHVPLSVDTSICLNIRKLKRLFEQCRKYTMQRLALVSIYSLLLYNFSNSLSNAFCSLI